MPKPADISIVFVIDADPIMIGQGCALGCSQLRPISPFRDLSARYADYRSDGYSASQALCSIGNSGRGAGRDIQFNAWTAGFVQHLPDRLSLRPIAICVRGNRPGVSSLDQRRDLGLDRSAMRTGFVTKCIDNVLSLDIHRNALHRASPEIVALPDIMADRTNPMPWRTDVSPEEAAKNKCADARIKILPEGEGDRSRSEWWRGSRRPDEARYRSRSGCPATPPSALRAATSPQRGGFENVWVSPNLGSPSPHIFRSTAITPSRDRPAKSPISRSSKIRGWRSVHPEPKLARQSDCRDGRSIVR